MAELYGFASTLKEAALLFDQGVTLVQFRNKELQGARAVEEARKMAELSRRYPGGRLIVNDDIETALAAGAWGVHLGQDDGDFRSLLKRYSHRLQIGVSIDTVEEALEAEAAGADYIGAGAVFGSQTKPEAPFMGTELLGKICRAVSCPVSAIGGITLENLPEVLREGPEYICVISDIHKQQDPAKRIGEYLTVLKENR